jgi:hypothetical protein
VENFSDEEDSDIVDDSHTESDETEKSIDENHMENIEFTSWNLWNTKFQTTLQSLKEITRIHYNISSGNEKTQQIRLHPSSLLLLFDEKLTECYQILAHLSLDFLTFVRRYAVLPQRDDKRTLVPKGMNFIFKSNETEKENNKIFIASNFVFELLLFSEMRDESVPLMMLSAHQGYSVLAETVATSSTFTQTEPISSFYSEQYYSKKYWCQRIQFFTSQMKYHFNSSLKGEHTITFHRVFFRPELLISLANRLNLCLNEPNLLSSLASGDLTHTQVYFLSLTLSFSLSFSLFFSLFLFFFSLLLFAYSKSYYRQILAL